MKNYIVYIHTNKLDGKKYIGITSQSVNRRWRNGNGYYENEHFYRAICRDGWENFSHEIVKSGLSKLEACELERRLIKEHRANDERYGYNKSTGGEYPVSGVKMSAETRAKMSESHKNIVFSDTRRKHMSEAAKKRGNGLRGKFGKESQTAGLVKQIDIESGEVVAEYYGFYEMERATGFGITAVRRAAYGEQRQSHGFKWEYVPKGVLKCLC